MFFLKNIILSYREKGMSRKLINLMGGSFSLRMRSIEGVYLKDLSCVFRIKADLHLRKDEQIRFR